MNTLKSQVQEKQREPQSNGLVLWPGWGRKAGAERRRVCWLPDQRLAPAWLGRSWVPPRATDGQACERSSCNWRPCINLSPLKNPQWVKGDRTAFLTAPGDLSKTEGLFWSCGTTGCGSGVSVYTVYATQETPSWAIITKVDLSHRNSGGTWEILQDKAAL